MGIRKWRQLSRLELTVQHARQRLLWVKEYESYSSADFRRIIWSDKCTVERGVGKEAVWTFKQPRDQLSERDVHALPHNKGVKQIF